MKRWTAWILCVIALMIGLTVSVSADSGDFVIENGVLTKYSGDGGDVLIPDSVTSIGDDAFAWCGNLTSVRIPNSVNSIGNYTFCGCHRLVSVSIPNSVISIGDSAFIYCSSLTSVSIPDSVTSIGDSAFEGCGSLASASISGSVTSIGNRAFENCSSLTSVSISGSVTSIGVRAFRNCSSLTSVSISGNVTSIWHYAFYGCSRLTSVSIPNSVTYIGECAFYNCYSLTSVSIPSSVTSIGNTAFRGCYSLTSVSIPNSVASIGSQVFYSCSSLTSVSIPNSVTFIGNSAFDFCSALTDVYYTGSESDWAAITGWDKSGLEKGTITIHYNSTPPSASATLAFDNQFNTVREGETISVTAEYISDQVPADIKWSCSDTENVQLTGDTSINGPSVTGRENTWWITRTMQSDTPGTYEISVSADDAITTTQLVILPKGDQSSPSLMLNRSEIHITEGNSYQLYATNGGENWNFYVEWSSSRAKYVTVENGLVKAVSALPDDMIPLADDDGYAAVVTARDNEGHTVSCKVYVSKRQTPFLFDGRTTEDFHLKEGNKKDIFAYLSEKKTYRSISDVEKDSITSIIWTTSDNSIIAFDKNGKAKIEKDKAISGGRRWVEDAFDSITVYARGAGKAKITCTVVINGDTITHDWIVRTYSNKGEEIINAMSGFTAAYNDYVGAVEDYMGKSSNEITLEQQGNALMESDRNSRTKLINFLSSSYENDPQIKKYVYQTVAAFMATKAISEFSQINVKGVDPASIASSIVNTVWTNTENVKYTETFWNGNNRITVTLKGIREYGSTFVTAYYGESGTQVAAIVSRPGDAMECITAYVTDLMTLDKELIKQSYKEVLKEFFSADLNSMLNDAVKKRVISSLDKYSGKLLASKVGKVSETVLNCIDYYQKINKLATAATDFPGALESSMSVLNGISFDNTTIEDRAVKFALGKLDKARKDLNKAMQGSSDVTVKAIRDVSDVIFNFCCPVNIAIYDNTGKQVGYIGEDDCWYDEHSIYISVIGDEKKIYSRDANLSFEVVGTDYGTLDCVVERINGGESESRTNYYDIPLYEGKPISLQSASDESEPFQVTADGTSIQPSETILSKNYDNSSVEVFCFSSNLNRGDVTGEGAYVRGDSVMIQASAKDGFVFDGWSNEDGIIVSKSPIYQFTARDDIVYIAEFSPSAEIAIYNVDVTKDAVGKVIAGVDIDCESKDDCKVYCAFYDANGRLLNVGVKELSSGENKDIYFSDCDTEAAQVKFFVVDFYWVPCSSLNEYNLS